MRQVVSRAEWGAAGASTLLLIFSFPNFELYPLAWIALAPLLCYEVLFPALAAQRRTPESVALVNLADDGWAPGSAASRHLTQLARFRAIEQRLPLVRLAHGGLSAVIDEYGRVIEQLPLDEYASRRMSLRSHALPTWYERASLLLLPLAVGAVVGWVP